MTRKNWAIEILPRALWVVQGVCLYLGQHFTNCPPISASNAGILFLGTLLTAGGFIFWMYVGYYMRHAFFDKELVTNGPFKYVRHPMYVAIYIMLSGVGLLFFSLAWFVIMAIFIPIWYIDSRIEERQMIGLHGRDYLDYKKRTGMFVPRVRW
ncbi:MAG: isoprenylcysteine carboxylmethyltransferase family protein [Thermoplasmata archaeon]|nr:isoprenylcysteine carboxylmethyltransferase family protein [Thermoplasmata archaeon]